MPVNMDPKKRLKKPVPQAAKPSAKPEPPQRGQPTAQAKPASGQQSPSSSKKSANLDDMTERDRELALADAEWKNLWDATEVIDMDKW